MPELRKDPIIGRWVIISTERAKRPKDFKTRIKEPPERDCPFCEGKEDCTPPEIFAIRDNNSEKNKPGWKVRVVPSIAPLLRIEGDLDPRGRGLYDILNGVGAHEVIIETPQHIYNIADLEPEQIFLILTAYKERLVDLENDPRLRYVLIYKNYGYLAGAGKIKHARSNLIASPIIPKRVKEELVGARRYFEYHDRCIFCDMIRQESEQKKRLVYENEGFFCFCPFASRFPFEVWVLPKNHSCDFQKCNEEELKLCAQAIKEVFLRLKISLNDPPYNFVLHTAPYRRKRPGYWRTILHDYHWHIEITPRLTRVAGFEWGTGFYICPTPPEEAAKVLREIENA